MSQTEYMTIQVGAIWGGYREDGAAGILSIDEYAGIWITMNAETFRTERGQV